MTSRLDDLARAIAQRRAILFAGAGVSMVVGLPSWRQLVFHMRNELGITEDGPEQEATYQTLAEYYRLTKGSIGPLRSWMDRHWSVSEQNVRSSGVHDAIVELDFPIVYTTNYDSNLEVAFQLAKKPYVKVANARDVASATGDVTQIVKFHGDFEDDQSLVIAETDYFNRLTFDSPLDIKFRADALGRTLLFVGYSVSDLNIRLLLHRLWLTWQASGREKDRPKSFVFMSKANRVQEAVLGQWGISVLSGDHDDPADGLLAFMTELRDRVRLQRSDGAADVETSVNS